MNLNDYKEIDITPDMIRFGWKPNIGDIVYHSKSKKIELVIEEDTDLIQTEFYSLIGNFGCLLLRKRNV